MDGVVSHGPPVRKNVVTPGFMLEDELASLQEVIS